jgi:hypothetical protein
MEGSRGRALARRFAWHLDSSASKIFDDSGSFLLHDRCGPGNLGRTFCHFPWGVPEPALHLSLGVFLF